MKKTLTILLCLVAFSCGYAQESNHFDPDILGFFQTLEGSWEGAPADSSFISVLEYNKGDKDYFVLVNNDLLSRQRKLFSHYEGIYFVNPDQSRIEFKTINKDEIHSGYCKISSDTLYHYATIKGGSGRIQAYASAIIQIDSQTIAYYASYSKTAEIPELTFEQPLVYRKFEK